MLFPAGGSSSSGGSWREVEGGDGVSCGVLLVVFPPPPPLGPGRALLRLGFAGTVVDVVLPLVESLVLFVLEDEVVVKILAEL